MGHSRSDRMLNGACRPRRRCRRRWRSTWGRFPCCQTYPALPAGRVGLGHPPLPVVPLVHLVLWVLVVRVPLVRPPVQVVPLVLVRPPLRADLTLRALAARLEPASLLLRRVPVVRALPVGRAGPSVLALQALPHLRVGPVVQVVPPLLVLPLLPEVREDLEGIAYMVVESRPRRPLQCVQEFRADRVRLAFRVFRISLPVPEDPGFREDNSFHRCC